MDILLGISEGINYANEHGIEHEDIKLENIVFGTTYVVDFGGRLRKTSSNDIIAFGQVGKILLENYKKNNKGKIIPKKLDRVIEKASNNEFKNVEELRDTIRDYKSSIIKKRFLKKAITVTLTSVALAYGAYEYNEYSKIDHELEDIVANARATDNYNVYQQLLNEIYDSKFTSLIKKIPKNKFPFKLDENGEYELKPNSLNDQGEFIRAITIKYLLTGDESYLKDAIERNKFLQIIRDESGNVADIDKLGINLTRIVRANTFLIDIIKQNNLGEKYYNKSQQYKDVKSELNSRLQEVANIFIENKYRESKFGGYFIMSPIHDANLLKEGKIIIRSGAIGILEGFWKLNDKSLEKKLFNHIVLSNKYLFRDDGSVRDAVIIDERTGEFIERNIYGWFRGDYKPNESSKSCYNWTLMDFLMGMEYAYSYLDKENKKTTAENLRKAINFYVDNFNLLKSKGFFEERFALPIDFYEPLLKNKVTWPNIKINNYPLILSLKVLTDALLIPDLVKDPVFKNKIFDVLDYTARNLPRNISLHKDIQGILFGASDTDKHLGNDNSGYYMYVDANYLEYMHYYIKNKKN